MSVTGPRLVLTNATVVDGDHHPVAGRTVVVDGKRISDVVEGLPDDVRADDRVVDLGGRTVMPGMVTCHFHSTYHELGSKPAPYGLEEPPALQVVRAVNNLGLAVRSGFTSAVSAGVPFAIDASMKLAIDSGLIVGPRLVPGSSDVSTTGHAGDKSFIWYWDVGSMGAIRRCDGPEEFRKGVREEIKRGAEIIKLFVTGGHGTVGPRESLEMTRDEMAAAIDAAHQRGAKVRGHIANREAIHMALDLGIDVIDHADGMDAKCIERIVASGTFVVPSVLFPFRFHAAMSGAGLGFTESMKADVDEALAILPVANAAGVKLVLGDDYGALAFPHGRYADELEFYVEQAGIPPLDVIRWATKHGAELMGRGDELGTVTPGKLADLLVVDGDPVADVRILQDSNRLLAVIKGGAFITDRLEALRQPIGLPA